MNFAAVLSLGFFLGMRHATDADHVVAVSTIVSRQRTLRAAAPIGILWGLGHTLTILLVGGAIIFFGVVIPPRLGLGMELAVAVMLVLLGAVSVRSVLRRNGSVSSASGSSHPHDHRDSDSHDAVSSVRPLVVGVVHGLAGSAAVALLVLGAIREPWWAMSYLLVFGIGTVAGMLLITTAIAMPVAATAQRFARLHRALGVATGSGSIAFGLVLIYEFGFVRGLFTGHPNWTPQ